MGHLLLLNHDQVVLPSYIGILVAVAGNMLISIALNLQKHAHNHCTSTSPSSSSSTIPLDLPTQPLLDSSCHYTKNPTWWIGVGLMLVGETGNFMAYGFAPASVIAPLGTVSLVCNALIAPVFLGESFRVRDLLGITLAISGTLVIITNTKSSEQLLDSDALLAAILSFRFFVYTVICLGTLAVLLAIYQLHTRTVVIDLSLVALFGGWTVISTKGISTLVGMSWFRIVTIPIFYPLTVILIVSGALQIKYLNTALILFDSTLVIPTQYVLFTISAVASSSVIYNDFNHQSPLKVAAFGIGCLMTFGAVYLIASEREQSVSMDTQPLVQSPTSSPSLSATSISPTQSHFVTSGHVTPRLGQRHSSEMSLSSHNPDLNAWLPTLVSRNPLAAYSAGIMVPHHSQAPTAASSFHEPDKHIVASSVHSLSSARDQL